ncbi:MAG: hypothetical protein JO281_00330 [Pseudonocardiales bacterium]|nr:hypothetical protein [Pseudonocardiales bacterium]
MPAFSARVCRWLVRLRCYLAVSAGTGQRNTTQAVPVTLTEADVVG